MSTSRQAVDGKPFEISKWVVWEAFRSVKANQGSAGVDGQSIPIFEKDLKGNLYRIWNRMSSGSYFPSPVRAVEIPKSGGGVRILGVPTVADRVAQTVVRMTLEPVVEPSFHPDSFGYRPGRSALDAVKVCRDRCWRSDWVIDLDIRAFFDSLDHDLLLKAVSRHTDLPWVLLYVKRWLEAPAQQTDGTLSARGRGIPQGSPISPLLANLFLHYAFDRWLTRTFPDVTFERYADDGVVHCSSRRRAETVLAGITARMAQVGLELHPTKTRIVYCKDSNRNGSSEHQRFTFLGYTFGPRLAKSRDGNYFVSFCPAAADDALKAVRLEIRRWRLHHRNQQTLNDLARSVNQVIAGWINYYGRFYRTKLYPTLQNINHYLARWATQKYKRLKRRKARARAWLQLVARRAPTLFKHWQYGVTP